MRRWPRPRPWAARRGAARPHWRALRHWWSFRENVAEDADAAIGFFVVFTGNNPEWQMSASFCHRLTLALTSPQPQPQPDRAG